MTSIIDILLFGFLVVTAFGIIRLRDLFSAVMVSGLFSLLSAGLFMVMDAVDVAITEAAVGAGISTILMLSTLAITKREEKHRKREIRRWPAAVCLLLGALLVYGTLDMPEYGDPDAPVHTYMTPHFIDHSQAEVGPPNMVTSVLASYRGYDTFGETTVVFTAAVGVLLLLSGRRRGQKEGDPSDDVTMVVDFRSLATQRADQQAERRRLGALGADSETEGGAS